MRITGVEARLYRFPYEPPLHTAWDPSPRTHQDACIVSVHTDDGVSGHASGDFLPDHASVSRLFTGVDPFRTELIREICETIDFHGGRPWTAEAAVWDVVGRATNQPVWKLMGGRNERLVAYASNAERVTAPERASRIAQQKAAGIRAFKIRFHDPDWRRDIAVVEHVRDAVGYDIDLMIDANQGWRMPGDTTARWDVATATQVARALEPLGVYWLEEPLPTMDIDGYALLRRKTSLRIAAGEMVRHAHEARDLITRGGVDVLQPDVVLTGGLGGCKRLAALADLHGRVWTPHTWSNGYGLVCNLHAALAFSGCPYVEVPYDPPALSTARRDWLLPTTVEIADDGTIAPPDGPGLGVTPDFDALEAFRLG
jgi:D-galactarolactone cycloisomerase